MDYTFDFYFIDDGNGRGGGGGGEGGEGRDGGISSQFIYDDPRFFSKLYLLIKSVGLLCYTPLFLRCETPELYIMMNLMMGLSTINTARYEYRHYKRYGTTFSSVSEFRRWKVTLCPQSRIVFSISEFILKLAHFIYVYPPQLDFNTPCNIGKSFLLLHTIILFCVYLLTGIFSCGFMAIVYGEAMYRRFYRGRRREGSGSGSGSVSFTRSFPNLDEEECCICLTNSNDDPWVILPCKHLFHESCISRWLITRDTCPVCRVRVSGAVT